MPGPSEIEIRPFYEMADFAGVFTEEEIAQKVQRREQLGM
jgi:hypothetical protein